MCGINGIFAYAGGRADAGELRLTRDFMAARGPDAHGEWFSPDGRIALGHRRLAIIDLSEGGAQPMRSADGKIVVTYNGEIYNHEELRRECEARGRVYRGRSDTETLIHLYALYGADMIGRLRGMFAFGLWDEDKQKLLLARDPYGIKPLYYADDGKTLRFASGVKALMASGQIESAPDAAGLAGYYLLGSVPEPFTTYKAIKSVPAGAWMEAGAKGIGAPNRYFSLAAIYAQAEASAPTADVETSFRQSALDSVRHHLIADVPVGAFLSSGVDSGALLGLMRDAGQDVIRTVTLGFEAFRGTAQDETPLAAEVARLYGADHVTRWVSKEEFQGDLPKILAAMDQPSIDGINTWFVSKATRELGLKVAISGLGGDELLGGYSTFARLPKIVGAARAVPNLPGLRGVSAAAVGFARALGLNVHPKTAALLTLGRTWAGAYLMQRGVFLPSELREAMADPTFAARGLAELGPLDMIARELSPEPRTDFGKVAVLESGFYMRNQLLRDADWAGMAHSLEIRTPLVDSELLMRVSPLFARAAPPSGKALLAKAPATPLPDSILNRAKTGFGVPLRRWYDDGSMSKDDRLWSRDWLKRVAAA